MDLGLRGRVALITGGSRGIGRATALTLADEGCGVAICARNPDQLAEVEAEVLGRGVACLTVKQNLSSEKGCEEFVAAAQQRFGRVDILVNNVTAEAMASPETGAEGLVQRIADKAMPAIRCARLCVPLMAEHKWGRILFLGGVAARMPLNEYSPYAGIEPGASTTPQGIGNAAVTAYAKYLSDEVGRVGITVNVVHPAPVLTERLRQRLQRYADGHALNISDILSQMATAMPIQRLVVPQDIAYAIAFLASERASAITGESIAVDAGFSRGIRY